MTLPLAVWVALAGIVYLSLVLAPFANRPSRQWLVLPAVSVVTIALLARAFGAEPPAHTAITGLLGIGLALLGVVAGSPIVGLVLRVASRDTVELGAHGGILVRDTPRARDREILRGGATIGYLERLALIGSVLVGQPAAVAVIVAVKGLGRFSELDSAEARERFIIGTLTSLVWAGACTAAVLFTR